RPRRTSGNDEGRRPHPRRYPRDARGVLIPCEADGVSGPLRFDPIEEAGRQWREHWGPDTVAPMSAVTSIMRVQQILLARLNELLEPYDLTSARYEALMLLFYSRRGELPLGKISDRLQVHRASVTNVIDK